MRVARALLSVTDKSGLVDLARFLGAQGVELIASGGTRRHLGEAGIASTELAEFTGSPECLDGRVKTLHPKVFGGILADPERHGDDLAKMDFPLIDLVVVNLYRFRETLANGDKDWRDVIEAIDIGGPSLLRAAAKNHERVTVLCDPGDYSAFMQAFEAGDGDPGREFRMRMAAAAFGHTHAYDGDISAWLNRGEERKPALPGLETEIAELRYGENPHQGAALHPWLLNEAPFVQLSGGGISYNNLLDLGSALDLILDMEGCAAAVIKHGNPCGVGFGSEAASALELAWSSDPISAFGSVIALNSPVDDAVADFLKKLFIEVIIAPGYSDTARERLAKKKRVRVLEIADPASWHAQHRLRSIGPLLLMQEEDKDFVPSSEWRHAAGDAPDAERLLELERAWRVVKHVKSNAIVVWAGSKLLGAGAGQSSRVDSCRLAIEKARQHGHDTNGAVAASDAFFPFPDGLEVLAEAGIAAVVQPGGSKRDEEVLARAQELGICVMLTGRRHFRH